MAARKKKTSKKKATKKKVTRKGKEPTEPIPTSGSDDKGLPPQAKGRRGIRCGRGGYTPAERDGIIAIVERCLQQGMGFQSACERAGVSSSTIIEWRKKDGDLDRQLLIAGHVLTEKATSKLRGLIEKGNPRAIEYYLDRRSPEFRDKRAVTVENAEDHGDKLERVLRALRGDFIPEPPDDATVEELRESATVYE